uniref:Secreted protein n=1 Tax=Haplochromis burtoni TaxID=8153 RepID=A0A3Q2W925_HAPBU
MSNETSIPNCIVFFLSTMTLCSTETKQQYFPQSPFPFYSCTVQSLAHSQTQDRNISPWIRYGYVCLLDSKRPVFR